MATTIFYTDFKSPAAMNLGIAWLEMLDRAVRRAAQRTVMFEFADAKSGQHAAYERLLDNLGGRGKPRRNAERFYRARLGYVIETEANHMLRTQRSGWRCMDGRPPATARPGDFLLQTPDPYGPSFPSNFRGADGSHGSRPDVRVALGDGTEALFDITSRGEEGHVLEKGEGHWIGMPSVAFIAEVIYDETEVAEDIARRGS